MECKRPCAAMYHSQQLYCSKPCTLRGEQLLSAHSGLTKLPILIAAPSGQAAIVNDCQHVALPACHAVHGVRIQATHSDRAPGAIDTLHSKLLLNVGACGVRLSITCQSSD